MKFLVIRYNKFPLDAFGDLKNRRPCPELVISDGGDISFAKFLDKGRSGFKTIDRDRHDTAAILYTGGTTGIPKGAMLTHGNIQTSFFNVAHYERFTEKDRALCFLPLNHVFGQIHITHSMVFCGGGLVLLPAFDLEKVLDAIQRLKVTNFYAVPSIYIRMLELDDLNAKIKSVRYCFSAAASMASEVVRECAVVGLPDRDWGERVTAFIVPHNNQQPDPAAIKLFLKEHLLGFKVPKEFIVVDELPKNNEGNF